MSDDTPDAHVDNAEPSMEDILASIRRIIADEDVASLTEDKASARSFAEAKPEILSMIEDGSSDVEAISPALNDETVTDLDLDLDLDDDNALSDMDLLLSELDDVEGVDKDDLETLDMQELDQTSGKLTGLGAVAAASFGAIASAGAATADTLSKSRKNPKPEPMPFDEDSLLGSNRGEALDLQLDQSDILSDSDDDLNSLLEIPDSDDSLIDDDIEALLGDMLFEESEAQESEVEDEVSYDERVVDPAADMIDAYEEGSSETLSDQLLADFLGDEELDEVELSAQPQPPNDLDLVKSLMADLTADPYDASDDIDTETFEDTETSEENELLDDILALSMEDERGLHADEDTSEDAGQTTTSDPFIIGVNEDLSAQPAPKSEAASTRSTLTDIADAAQQDAQRIERRSNFGANGFAAGAGIIAASAGSAAAAVKASSNDDAPDEIKAESEDLSVETDTGADIDMSSEASNDLDFTEDSEIDIIEAEPTPQEITATQETADMPKAAAKKDTIIDEVTAEATAGAFASLSQVVENQAVVADRGDRIGDLVTEALRPMLKEWLDKNLKGIVERAVTKEVKRISTGK